MSNLSIKASLPVKVVRSLVVILIVYGLMYYTGVLNSKELPYSEEWPVTDFSKRSIELSEIFSGGPPKDGIPAIDKPIFVSSQEANHWLNDDEPVIVAEYGQRAYPIQILMYHEIVNDQIDGRPVAVTFCPLCNAAMVFNRRLNGKVLDFGTTGKLRNSDLVMYDRQSESWWQQFTGTGIVGHYTGQTLQEIPAHIVSYADFKKQYPQGEVLSRKTGYVRSYGNNPYQGYDDMSSTPYFPVQQDSRLLPMERLLGVRNQDKLKLYPFKLVREQGVVNDTLESLPLVVFSKEGVRSPLDEKKISQSRLIAAVTAFDRRVDGKTLTFVKKDQTIMDEQTNSAWSILGKAYKGVYKDKQLKSIGEGSHFAFAWLAFSPNAEIYKQ